MLRRSFVVNRERDALIACAAPDLRGTVAIAQSKHLPQLLPIDCLCHSPGRIKDLGARMPAPREGLSRPRNDE